VCVTERDRKKEKEREREREREIARRILFLTFANLKQDCKRKKKKTFERISVSNRTRGMVVSQKMKTS
jgi:hypothetical protein